MRRGGEGKRAALAVLEHDIDVLPGMERHRAGIERFEHHAHDIDGEQLIPFGLEYFHQGIPCPFLENESCSIHEERPISCREYLVTSPAEHCAKPKAGTVQCVPLGATVSKAVKSLGGKPSGRILPWVPLILADEWAESHEEEAMRPAPELLRTFLERLGDQQSSSTPVTSM